jgi:predicted lipoprotein with Yx(FWY)xxD motif
MTGIRSKAGIFGLLVGAAILLAACGGKAGSGSGTGGGNTSKSGELGTRSISGIGAVLQAPSGFTLYHLTTETNGKVSCTGNCASTWPPLIASSGKVPAASPDVAGHLGTVERPDGSLQVTFDGMPLYTYAGDSGPGQANGQGIGGVWFAVTTSAASSSNTGPPGY